ncbi:MAG: T9SS type A sorting domain-containing protein [Flavobacteriales bacterium]
MKKKSMITLGCFIACTSYAQFQINYAQQFPVAGTKQEYSYSETPVSVGNSGTNISWNYYPLQSLLNKSLEITMDSVGAIDSASAFPYGDAILLRETGKNNISFPIYKEMLDTNYYTALFEIGTYDSKYHNFITYSKPLKKLHYPFSYLDEFTDNTNYTAGISDVSIRRRVKADAWGNINIPHVGNRECLRVVTYDTIRQNGCGLGGCIEFINYITTYEWYGNTESQPVMKYEITESKGDIIQKHKVMTLNNNALSANHTNKNDLNIYPNPFSETLNFPTISGNVKIFDESGKIIINTVLSHQNQLNLSALHQGVYFIEIISDNGEKLLLDKIIKN